MIKHQEKHFDLNVEGCFGCKIASVKMQTAGLQMEREGKDATGGMGTRNYVKQMYNQRRKDGLPDPYPKNKKAAQYAPAKGVVRDKKYKEANGGL